MADLNARTAVIDDYDDVITLYDAVIKSNKGTAYDVYWDLDAHPSRQDLRCAIEQGELVVATMEGFEGLAAASMLSGSCTDGYRQAPWVTGQDDGDVRYIHALCTNPAIVHQGIGTRFIGRLADIARNAGARSIRLDVLPHNAPARGLYAKCGFVDHGVFKLDYEDAPVEDFCLMELIL